MSQNPSNINSIIQLNKKQFTLNQLIKVLADKDVIEFDQIPTHDLIRQTLNDCTTNMVIEFNRLQIPQKTNATTVNVKLIKLMLEQLEHHPNISIAKRSSKQGPPKKRRGGTKFSGYSDLEIKIQEQIIYLSINAVREPLKKSPRDFYMSPAGSINEFKIHFDAPHLVIGLNIKPNTANLKQIISWKLADIYNLKFTTKIEFNAYFVDIFTVPRTKDHN